MMSTTPISPRPAHGVRRGRLLAAPVFVALLLVSGCARDRTGTLYQVPTLPRIAPPLERPAALPVADVPASYMVLLPDADGRVGQASMQTAAGRTLLTRANQGADLAGGAQPFGVTDAQVQRDFGAVLAARPPYPERFRLFYGTRDSALSEESLGLIDRIVQRSRQFNAAEITLIGHTDTRGNPRDNQALGLRRAQELARLLVSRGVQAVEIEVGSDGERNPLVPTPDQTAEPRNRRVEITLK